MQAEENQPQQAELEQKRDQPRQAPLRCANCDIEILWSPVEIGGKTYCCRGCAAGGPCNCDYSQYHSVNIAGVIHYGMN